jgi:LysM repeat protein
VALPTAPVPAATPEPTEVSSAETSPSAPSTSGKTIVHTVKRGESLSLIAQRYGTTWQAIAEANDLSDPRTIVAGQKLKIPASGTTSGGSDSSGCRRQHVVKKGEWVWQIARDYGVSPYSILAANDLTIKQARNIQAGQRLCIP